MKTNVKFPPPPDTGGLAQKSLPSFSAQSIVNSPKLPWAIVAVLAAALLLR